MVARSMAVRQQCNYQLAFYVLIALCFITRPVYAQVVDDVAVRRTAQGYEIEIKFFIPLRQQSHSPNKSGNTLQIQLRPGGLASPEVSDQLQERTNLSWDNGSGIPLREIVYDGKLTENPTLLLRFSAEVEFTVRSSKDLRSIIITVINSTEFAGGEESSIHIISDSLMLALKQSEPRLARLLEMANTAMLDKNYSRAVQLYTSIREQSTREIRQHVQELLGLAREYNGQLAHAKAEYELYLKLYTEGKDADRVRQRLTALITAAKTPKQKLRAGRRQRSRDGEGWDTQFYGSFSQIYYRDETTPEDQDTQLIRSDLNNDLDFIGRARKGDYDLRTQFIGSYREDLRSVDNVGGEFIPSIISVEAGHSGAGLYARVGRQSRTTGGVLGRFDGIHAAYEINPAVSVNAVYGYPVDIMNKTTINSDQEFYGLSVDVGTLWDAWDFNTYYITQDNAGIKDREAVGGELRFIDATKSLFTLVDYDIFYSELNIFLLIANWTITEGTTLNVVMDYRNSPILMTTSAIQGQGVEKLDELFDLFSEDELHQLAIDRTSDSQSLTAGVTQQLSENWQVIAELTVTEFGETQASGGVEAIVGTGKEYFYSTQLVANSLIFDNDIMIMGLRYSDTFNADNYSMTANWRINLNRTFRLNPRIRVDYRQDKTRDNNRWLVRPFIRGEYRFRKWINFEADLGYEWLDETFAGQKQTTTGYYFSIGYRAQF